MNEQSAINKKAWEYRAYEFWTKSQGTPQEKAQDIIKNPFASLKKHQQYFEQIAGKRIANLCGSNGRKAVPLSLLGGEVTVFDISEENKRYAMELAHFANTNIQYNVTDIYEIDVVKYGSYFDVLYLEGGILHYFQDINRLMDILYALLKEGGQVILSDFHPLRRCLVDDYTKINYFDQQLQGGDLAYKSFFDEGEQKEFPEVSVRLFTLSEIINAVITSGFTFKQFEEHRGWNNENIPWEFTILATK
ncbi:class I SAM-dependent methyltransferase [Sutcliffiella rhizosphaerae]|uniref:Methyltransferase type 11 domain-containing protein n=1 Tax=Sutcliffiella rhizosphaerae TaxID=2880967 RepID=A0ABN8A874_9BACI|nr:class I SAM-dependent methyltransferase [Sutcliffiella rhizosphaerae]CAG9621269.1 hypothetical protein BACCIP111883_02041 [Sutcliffiella rhizosphaerae]